MLNSTGKSLFQLFGPNVQFSMEHFLCLSFSLYAILPLLFGCCCVVILLCEDLSYVILTIYLRFWFICCFFGHSLFLFFYREYPCDHYTSVINVTLLMTGCPRGDVHSIAVQLLQVLDKRFFGNVGPLQNEGEKGEQHISIAFRYTYI